MNTIHCIYINYQKKHYGQYIYFSVKSSDDAFIVYKARAHDMNNKKDHKNENIKKQSLCKTEGSSEGIQKQPSTLELNTCDSYGSELTLEADNKSYVLGYN